MNAADVWMNRALAEIYEQVRHDAATAKQHRAEAGRIAAALNEHLYQSQGDHAGTWKQRHANGDGRQWSTVGISCAPANALQPQNY